MLVPQFWCFAIAVHCFVQSPHFVFFQSCVIPLVRFWWFCKQILVDIRVQECCVTSLAIVLWSDSGSLSLSCELAASIVFGDSVDGIGENI